MCLNVSYGGLRRAPYRTGMQIIEALHIYTQGCTHEYVTKSFFPLNVLIMLSFGKVS